jgi:hypothetical protein
MEHRFFGLSNPKPDLTTQSLQLLTLQQSIEDLDYFAKNVKLPMPGGDKVTPDVAPWVLVGGSYAGALTSWSKVISDAKCSARLHATIAMTQVDSFYAGYASSAVVEAITDFWAYFEPIRQQMPKNCSADVEAVISHIDSVSEDYARKKAAIYLKLGLHFWFELRQDRHQEAFRPEQPYAPR